MKVKVKVSLISHDGTVIAQYEYEYGYDIELLDRITISDLIQH